LRQAPPCSGKRRLNSMINGVITAQSQTLGKFAIADETRSKRAPTERANKYRWETKNAPTAVQTTKASASVTGQPFVRLELTGPQYLNRRGKRNRATWLPQRAISLQPGAAFPWDAGGWRFAAIYGRFAAGRARSRQNPRDYNCLCVNPRRGI